MRYKEHLHTMTFVCSGGKGEGVRPYLLSRGNVFFVTLLPLYRVCGSYGGGNFLQMLYRGHVPQISSLADSESHNVVVDAIWGVLT